MIAVPCWAAALSLAIALAACGPRKAAPGPVAAERITPPAPPVERFAELVLVGGVVHTMVRGQPAARGVAIAEGKIAAVGSDEELEVWIGPKTKVIGLDGKTVVPGLVDGHYHLFGVGALGMTLDLTGTTSIKDIRDRVAKAARESPAGAWVRGRGWDQNDWSGSKAFPTAQDLDPVAPNNPVALERVDGHALWANSAAMRAAGIDRNTPDPAGGKLIRAGGKPTGVFIDNATALVEAFSPAPTVTDLRKQAYLGVRESLKVGLTQIHDMGLSRAEIEVLREMDREGELQLRVFGLLEGWAEDLDAAMGSGPEIAEGDRRLTVRGVKFLADGALGSRGAALIEPYADDPKNRGLILVDEAMFEARVRSVKERGYQVATHAIGDRANRFVLDVYERVFGGNAKNARPRIEHAQVVSPDDLPRFAALGVIASMQPTHCTSDMPWAEARVGPERVRGAYAWRTLRVAGATIAAGSDAPVESPAPLLGLYAAMTRQDSSGAPAGGWRVEERLDPSGALAVFTRGGAFASFREGQAGAIVEGWDADLTVLDVDPLGPNPAALLKGHAELTIIGGKIAYARPGADRPPKPKAAPVPTSTVTAGSSSIARRP